MKKLLALVLALVMTMSLVTISNAAYSDKADIDLKEAVDVMNAVGVFIGDEKGNFNAKENLTREKAAQMTLNALKAPTVEYSTKGSSISVNGAEINFGASTPKYVTSELASARNISSDQLSNQNGYTVELGEKLYPKLVLVDGDYTEAYDTFLRPADTWYYKNQKIGTYAWTPDLTYTKSVSASELYMDLGISTVANGKKASYVAVDGVRNATQESYLIQKSNTTDKFGGNGVLTEVYKDDNFVYIVEINTYVGDVSAVSAGTKTQNAYVTIANRGSGTSGTYETTDFAVDDVVLYTYSYKLDGTKYEGIQSVTKAAAKITGNLSEVTLGKNATVGSTKYDFSKKIANAADTTMLKYDVDVILDSYGYAIDIQPTNTNTAYAYVLNVKATAGDFNTTAKAELLFTDGTTQVVSLNNKKGATQVFDKDSTATADYTSNDNGDIIRVGDIVKYQVNNAGKYTLDRVAATNGTALAQTSGFVSTMPAASHTVATTNGSYQFTFNSSATNKANGKTLFLVATKNGTGTIYTVYEGIKNVPSIANSDGDPVNAMVYFENSVAKIVFIDATAAKTLVSSSTVIFLKPNSTMTATTNSKLGTYYTYSEAIVNGEKVEDFKVAADSFANVAAARAGGMFTAVAYDDNQIATVSSPIGVATGTGKYYNKTVTIAGSAYTYTDDVNVWYLDTNDVLTKVTVTAVADDANDKVYVKKNAGNEITDIVIIEVENKAPSNDASIKSITVKGVEAKLVDGVYTATVDAANTTAKQIVIDAADGATVEIVKKGESSEYAAAGQTTAFPAGNYEFTITVTSEDGAMVKSYTLKFAAVTYYTLTLQTNSGKAAMVSVDGAEAVEVNDSGIVGGSTIKVADGAKIAVTEISGGTTVSIGVTNGTAWVAGTNTWTLRGISADPTVTLTIA